MPYTFPSPSIPTSDIKVSWKEQYGSAGFNYKLGGITPTGIYRGLTLSTSLTDNTVTVVPDPTHEDHLAVFENTSGFSITFRDMSDTTYSLSLAVSTLYSQTVVITFFVDYTIGQATSASFIAYTMAEWLALPAATQDELVVLGTVANPAASNLVTLSDISSNLRTIASLNQSLLTWRSVIANPEFQRSPTPPHEVGGNEVDGWTASSLGWFTNSTDVASGDRAMTFHESPGTWSTSFLQNLGIGVVAGQQIYVQLQKKAVQAATSGTGAIVLEFSGANGGSQTSLSSDFTITSLDASYQTVTAFFTVPANMTVWNYASVQLAAADYASSGDMLRIGTFFALLQPESQLDQLASWDERWRDTNVTSLTLNDPTSTSYSDIGVTVKFSQNNPNTTEGQLQISRKDGLASDPPAISHPGRIVGLGSGLLGSSADSYKARIEADGSAAVDLTLIFQSNSNSGLIYRKYTTQISTIIETWNASWNGTVWNYDNASDQATCKRFSNAAITWQSYSGANGWLDSAWGPLYNNSSSQTRVIATGGSGALATYTGIQQSTPINVIGGITSNMSFDLSTGGMVASAGGAYWYKPLPIHWGDYMETLIFYFTAGGTSTITGALVMLAPGSSPSFTTIASGTSATAGYDTIFVTIDLATVGGNQYYVYFQSGQNTDVLWGASIGTQSIFSNLLYA